MLLGLFVVEYFHLRCKWILLPALANYYQVYLQGYLCIVLLVLAMVKQAIVAPPPEFPFSYSGTRTRADTAPCVGPQKGVI